MTASTRMEFEEQKARLSAACEKRKKERERIDRMMSGAIPLKSYAGWGVFYGERRVDSDGAAWHHYTVRRAKPIKPKRVKVGGQWRSIQPRRNVIFLEVVTDGIVSACKTGAERGALKAIMPKRSRNVVEWVQRDAEKREAARDE